MTQENKNSSGCVWVAIILGIIVFSVFTINKLWELSAEGPGPPQAKPPQPSTPATTDASKFDNMNFSEIATYIDRSLISSQSEKDQEAWRTVYATIIAGGGDRAVFDSGLLHTTTGECQEALRYLTVKLGLHGRH